VSTTVAVPTTPPTSWKAVCVDGATRSTADSSAGQRGGKLAVGTARPVWKNVSGSR
jgi:hypothetical protein